MVLMIGQSILRELHVRTGAVNDVVSWLCAAAAFFAMAHAFKHGDFVRVTLLLEKVSPAAQRRFEMAALAIAAVAVGYLAWWANRFTWDSFVFDETAQGMLPIKMWIPQSTFAIGAILLFVAVIDELVVVVARRPAELRRRGRGAARARRLLVRGLTESCRRHGHPRRRRDPARPDAGPARRRRLDRDDAGDLRLGRPGLLHDHAAGQEPVLGVLGVERLLGAGGAAPLHLDGRDPLSHPPLRRDVRRASRRG